MTKSKPKPKVLTKREGRLLLQHLPEAPEGLTYVVVGPYVWGKSKVAERALEEAWEAGGSSPGTHTVHLLNEGAEVDSVNGTVYYNSKLEGVRPAIAHFKA